MQLTMPIWNMKLNLLKVVSFEFILIMTQIICLISFGIKGYRVCLIYSLCLVNANTNPLNVPKTVIEGMKSTLNVMNEYSYDMAILLDHKYTGRSIETTGIKALKGVDNDRFRLLNSANEKLPEDKQVVFYIAHANLVIDTYEITGYYEEIGEFGYRPRRKPKWEENERSVSIETIYDLKGAKKFENTTVDLEFFDTFIHPGRRDDADLNSSKAWGNDFFVLSLRVREIHYVTKKIFLVGFIFFWC